MQICTRRRWPSDTLLSRQLRSTSRSFMSLIGHEFGNKRGVLERWEGEGEQNGRETQDAARADDCQREGRCLQQRQALSRSPVPPLRVHAFHPHQHLPRRNVALQTVRHASRRKRQLRRWQDPDLPAPQTTPPPALAHSTRPLYSHTAHSRRTCMGTLLPAKAMSRRHCGPR